MIECPKCKGKMFWQSDFSLDKVYPDLEEEGIVRYCHCYHCESLVQLVYIEKAGIIDIDNPTIIVIEKDED